MSRKASIPRWGLAVLGALHLSERKTGLLARLTDDEWHEALRFCDAAQVTLTFGAQCKSELPEWVAKRIGNNYDGNRKRFLRLRAALLEIAECFSSRGLDFAILKGFAQPQGFTPDHLLRTQGDIDLWCLPPVIARAERALRDLGYRPIGHSKGRHLAPMIKEQSWSWRGDYFDPDLPIPVDLHFALWDESLEQISGPPEPAFWERRHRPAREGGNLPVLADADALSFAALHLLMHTLHGDVRLQRAWEIAHFLKSRTDDHAFWLEWQATRSPELRRLEAIVFVLVSAWFGSPLPERVREDVDSIPEGAKNWIECFAFAPLEALFQPNKTELWLNLELVRSMRGKLRILQRRLVPLSRPSIVSAQLQPNAQAEDAGLRSHILALSMGRFRHHSAVLIPTLLQGIGWFWSRRAKTKDPKYQTILGRMLA